nr:MAG TPA: hypothetical protein [Caudoviricetes sp.]
MGISLKKIDNDRLNNAKLASFDEIDKVLVIYNASFLYSI